MKHDAFNQIQAFVPINNIFPKVIWLVQVFSREEVDQEYREGGCVADWCDDAAGHALGEAFHERLL